jgi:HEAT repeat protein
MEVFPRRSRVMWALVVFLSPCHLVTLSPCHGEENVIDSPMWRDPDVPRAREVVVFPARALELWLRALERPEADLRQRAAQSIVLAKRRGMKGLDKAIAPLRAALDRPEQHPAARLADARALIELEARAEAAALWRAAQRESAGRGDLADLVEPVLARWDHKPARPVWLSRLADPETRRRDLLLAIRCLGSVGEAKASDRLRTLALAAETPGAVRLEAARALALLRADGLEKDAKTLLEDKSRRGLSGRLAAATLLSRHRGKEAAALLREATNDREPAVAAIAVARLLDLDLKLAAGAVKQLLASPDVKLRAFGVEVLLRDPTREHIRLLGVRLDDDSPDVRVKARQALRTLAANKERREAVVAEALAMLAKEGWRGQEQSAILLAQVDHRAAAARLVRLLSAARPEVFVAAAWGLRKLAVVDTLPAVVKYLVAEYDRQLGGKDLAPRKWKSRDFVDHQLSQLAQLLGQQRYAPADRVLRRFVAKPMPPGHGEARSAAIWALSLIHEGKKVPDLASALAGRLDDSRSIPPENPWVREMSAIALGRLKAKEALPTLRKHCPTETLTLESVNNAAAWAIAQVTGKAMPAAPAIESRHSDKFLKPFE